jgi:hypothetical protein
MRKCRIDVVVHDTSNIAGHRDPNFGVHASLQPASRPRSDTTARDDPPTRFMERTT